MKVVNGGYYCDKHEAKNCTECFDQDTSTVIEKIKHEILTNPKIDYENLHRAGFMEFLDKLEVKESEKDNE